MLTDLEPGLFLRYDPEELKRKTGRRSDKPPIVRVTRRLRASRRSELGQGLEVLSALPEERQERSLPLKVQLREKALAKSNRPTEFLDKAYVAPAASIKTGELVSRATSAHLQLLQSAMESVRDDDIYAISTIESFSVWRPVEDAFGAPTIGALSEHLEEVKSHGRSVKIDLFPWLTFESEWSKELTLAEFLESIGLRQIAITGTRSRPTGYFDIQDDVDVDELSSTYGIRTAQISPEYSAFSDFTKQSIITHDVVAEDVERLLKSGPETDATVGVLDGGISSDLLEPWVRARETYDPVSEVDFEHGTFVAGLVVASRALNHESDDFPEDEASIVDAQVLGAGSTDELTLTTRIEEILHKYSESVKVWNCSFSEEVRVGPVTYGTMASQMDRWSEKFGVLFVQAAGNYSSDPPREWPPDPTVSHQNQIATPAEAVNSLTVGSLSHLGGVAPVGAPSSYSRCGPSFGGQQKPDVCHWSGDIADTGSFEGTGVLSVSPTGDVAESVGTSFATPIVSALAANVWQEMSQVDDLPAITPSLTKGLLVHSAAVRSEASTDHQHFFGAGVPAGEVQSLFDAPDSFTTVHEVDLASVWLRSPFPIPKCLFTPENKLQAEITMTVAYSPIIDDAFGEEAVRTSVQASFGTVSEGKTGPTIKGKVKAIRSTGGYQWEAEQIAEGKWAPIKTYRKVFSQGASGDEWGLRLELTDRAGSDEPLLQRVYVIVTLKSLDPDLPVRVDGLQEVQRLKLWHAPLSNRARISIEA